MKKSPSPHRQPAQEQSKYPGHLRMLIADRLSLDNDESSNPKVSLTSPGAVNSEKEFIDPWEEIERSLLGE